MAITTVLALGAAVIAGAPASAAAVPVPADAYGVATQVSSWGPRPATSAREERAHRLMRRVFRRAELRVGIQEFRVPGRGRSRNAIGVYDTPRSCLRIVMAHTDTTPAGPGANDNASGLGVVASLAGRLRLIKPWCDVWLVATGAEERVYTGSPDPSAHSRWRGARARTRRGSGSSSRSRSTRSAATARSGCGRPSTRRASGSRARCSRPPAASAPRSAGSATRARATPTTASSSCSGCLARSSAWAPAASRAAIWPATAPRGWTASRSCWPGRWRPRRCARASSRPRAPRSRRAGARSSPRPSPGS
jgi:hypothetical protein